MKHVLLVVATAVLSACSSQSRQTPAAQQGPAKKAEIGVTSKSPEAVAHFKKGQVLFDNLRVTEAAAEFGEALKLDPEFAQARAYHGLVTPGPEGLKELEAAASAAAGGLPETERVLIEGLAAGRRGDPAQARTSLRRLTELAPDDWSAHYVLGQQLLVNRQYDEAVPALKKATSLNPNAGGAQNMLGYAALRQGDAEGAVAAFQEYARILPQEPNPQDSLGEALLAAGRFKESEAAFQKALALSPEFWNAHEGMAYARFYSGDWAGGREALARAKAGAPRPVDKISVDDELAAAAIAQRDSRTALTLLDAMEKTSGASPADLAFVPVRRALALSEAGRAREALAPIAVALKTADSGQLGPGATRTLRRQALIARIALEAQARDVPAATKTSAALDEAASSAPDDPFAATAMHFGRGMLSVAKQDTAGALTHFDQCSTEDEFCKWQAVTVAEKAGNKAAAEATRAKLLKNYARDPLHLIIRSRLTPPARK